MPRSQSKPTKLRHDPLLVQIKEDENANHGVTSNPRSRKKSHKPQTDSDDDDEKLPSEVVLDSRTSRRILDIAQAQRDEDGSDGMSDDDEDEDDDDVSFLPMQDVDDELDDPETSNISTTAIRFQTDSNHPNPAAGLDPKVVDAYTKLGQFLHKYKSGPLPKLFKVIPTLRAWARILALTRPENWSPHACRAATRIFISNMKPAQAQLFLNVVLLNAIREDIQANKTLNPQYYESLKRALYKPSAFFKGIVFPLLDQGCTLKEAAIIASVMARTKIPVLHSSAALLRIAEMDYTGPNSLFLRVLIDKKYELPYKVVDALVFHFIRLSNTYKAKSRGDSESLPVLWHQSLLAFVQRYASDLTCEQRDALFNVIRTTPHAQIGPEIRRELISTTPRGGPLEAVGDIQMS